jgi:hypothetical protein
MVTKVMKQIGAARNSNLLLIIIIDSCITNMKGMRQYDRMVMGWNRRSLLVGETPTNTFFGPDIRVSSNGGDATSIADEMPLPQLTSIICVQISIKAMNDDVR